MRRFRNTSVFCVLGIALLTSPALATPKPWVLWLLGEERRCFTPEPTGLPPVCVTLERWRVQLRYNLEERCLARAAYWQARARTNDTVAQCLHRTAQPE